MSRFILILLVLASIVLAGSPVEMMVQAEADTAAKVKYGWKNSLLASLNFNQTQFSNWTKGGENSLSWQMLFNGSFDYIRPMWDLDTEFKLNYGRNKVGDNGDRKTNDEIRLDVVYNYNVWEVINPYASARFLSQIDAGYEYTDTSETQVSAAFDPAYLTMTLGMGYKYEELLKLNLGPSVKLSYSEVYSARYTDDPGTPEIEKQKWDSGFEFFGELNWKILENLGLQSKLTTFTDFDKFATDVNWDNILVAKVADWLNFNIQYQLIYDEDVLMKAQQRQAIALGLSYTLF